MDIEINERDLDDMLQGIVSEVRTEMTNDLYNEITHNIVEMNLIGWTHQLLTEIYLDLKNGEIHFNAPWAGYVEYGTPGNESVPVDPWEGTDLAGPGMSRGRKKPSPEMIESLTHWIKVKGATKVDGRVKYLSKSESEQAGNAIAWYIYKHGTQPHPFARNGIDTIRTEYEHSTITMEVGFG